MSTDNWNKVENIVDGALSLPQNERAGYIESQCGKNIELRNEANQLLEAIENSDGFLECSSDYRKSILGDLFPDSDLVGNASLVGERVDQYRITKLIGHGGMGSVYRAIRADGAFDQVVAIKVIRKGMDTPTVKARFQQERQILARLNHPSIARLYDGGMTDDGLPYLVMEHVEGLPIDQYCDQHKLAIKKRIELFKSVCQAVQHAHTNLIIHRDLKPQNILVTEKGEVKILDFGIAKLTKVNESDTDYLKTREGNRFLTPGYASPEQIQSKPITTSTDIFTLGVLFHKLMAGVHPYDIEDKGYTEIQNVILQNDPCGLKNILNHHSRVQLDELAENRGISHREFVKQLDSDLDAIISKSLRKDPAARYNTVRELVDDIGRYQAGMPVQAHEGTVRYNMTKFINRHRTGLSTAVAAFLLVVGFFSFYTVQITKERNQAQAEANKASQVTALLFNLFEASDPAEALGDTITARELLSRGVSRAEHLDDKPEFQAQMFDLIGQIYHRLGNYRKSKLLLEDAIDLRKAHLGPQHIETAKSMNHLGALLSDMGHYKTAETYLRKAGRIFENHQELNDSDLARIQSNLAYSLRRQGSYDEAESYLRRSLDILYHNFGKHYPKTISTLNKLGVTLHNKGDYDSAEEIYRNVLDLRKSIVGEKHPDIAESLNSLAALLMNKGQYSEAEELLFEALSIRKTVYRDNHPKVALTLNNLGLVYRDLHKFDQAEYYFNKSLKMRLQLLGGNHIETAISWFSLAESKLMSHQPDSALKLFNKAKPVFQNSLSKNHSFIARTRMGIGNAYLLKDHVTKAGDYLRAGYEQICNIHPEYSLERAIADRQMSDLYMALGEDSKADSLSNRAKTILNLIGQKAPSGRNQQQDIVQYF